MEGHLKKREPRVTTAIPARVRLGSRWLDVTIRNLSAHGMMLQSSDVPSRGSYIELRRASHVVVGRVVWSDGEQCGVRAQDVIDVASLADMPRGAPAWKAGDPDRRRRERTRIEDGEARSHILGKRLQFVAITLFVLAGCFVLLKMVSETFTSAMQVVTQTL